MHGDCTAVLPTATKYWRDTLVHLQALRKSCNDTAVSELRARTRVSFLSIACASGTLDREMVTYTTRYY